MCFAKQQIFFTIALVLVATMYATALLKADARAQTADNQNIAKRDFLQLA